MKKFGKLTDRKNADTFKTEEPESNLVSLSDIPSEEFFRLGYEDAEFKVSIAEADADISASNRRKAFLYIEPEKAVAYILYWGLANDKREDTSMIAHLLGKAADDVVKDIVDANKFISEELDKLENDDRKTLRKYINTPDTTYTEILEDYLAEREDKDSSNFRYLSMIARNSTESKTLSK